VAGESFLQSVVPKARRKHVLNLRHDVFGGHMDVKRTKERIEFTFYWPTFYGAETLFSVGFSDCYFLFLVFVFFFISLNLEVALLFRRFLID